MLSRIAIALCLFGAGCASEVYDGGRLGGRSLEKELCPTGCSDDVTRGLAIGGQWEPVGGNAWVNVVAGEIAFDDACAQLPDVGYCSLACTPEALGKRVPSGTCIDFACALPDGRLLLAGACAADVELSQDLHGL